MMTSKNQIINNSPASQKEKESREMNLQKSYILVCDQSETEDIFVTKENIKPIKSFEKKTSRNGIYCCCDQSETDTILLREF